MKKLLLLLTLASLAPLARPQDEPKPPRTEAGELRLELTNALIKEIKSTREVRYRVKWHYLPDLQADPKAKTTITFGGKKAEPEIDELVFKNSDLRTMDTEKFFEKMLAGDDGPKWQKFLNALTNPIKPSEPKTFKDAMMEGRKYWEMSLFKKLFAGTETKPVYSRYSWYSVATAQQSFHAMEYLFGNEIESRQIGTRRHSNGAAFLVEAQPDPRGKNPLTLADDLEWHIQMKATDLGVENPTEEIGTDKKKRFYTFSAYVISREIRQTLRNAADLQELRVNVIAGMLRKVNDTSFEIRHPATFDGTAKVPPIPEGLSQLAEFDDELGASVGSFTLGNLTGQSTASLLSPLFDNDSDASPFFGSLIGGGPSAPVYGLNYVLSPDERGSLGFLYGFVSNADSALYLGPSLSWGPFTLSAGARIFNREDDAVSARLSGALSIDLNQLFGKDSSQIIEPRKEDNISFWPQISRNEELVLLKVSDAPPGTVFNVKKDDKPYGQYVVPADLPQDAVEPRLISEKRQSEYQAFTSLSTELLTVHAPRGYMFLTTNGALTDSEIVSRRNDDGRVFTRVIRAIGAETVGAAVAIEAGASSVGFHKNAEPAHTLSVFASGNTAFVVGWNYAIDAGDGDVLVIGGEGNAEVRLKNEDKVVFTVKDGSILVAVGTAPPVQVGTVGQPLRIRVIHPAPLIPPRQRSPLI